MRSIVAPAQLQIGRESTGPSSRRREPDAPRAMAGLPPLIKDGRGSERRRRDGWANRRRQRRRSGRNAAKAIRTETPGLGIAIRNHAAASNLAHRDRKASRRSHIKASDQGGDQDKSPSGQVPRSNIGAGNRQGARTSKRVHRNRNRGKAASGQVLRSTIRMDDRSGR